MPGTLIEMLDFEKLSILHPGRIINDAYLELGVALDKLNVKREKNVIKKVRRQLLRLLESERR